MTSQESAALTRLVRDARDDVIIADEEQLSEIRTTVQGLNMKRLN